MTNSGLRISVVIPAHNPHLGRLRATLAGLAAQSLDEEAWETIIVDNASTRFPEQAEFADVQPANLRMVREPRLGLTFARICGFHAARADVVVLVDDDNVLQADYLAHVGALFSARPRLGVAGGKVLPRFEHEPPAWTREFFPLLALRDLGDCEQVAESLRPAGAERNQYPGFAPLGAGMAIRRPAWEAWLEMREGEGNSVLSDRRGNELTSAGDNDIVFCAMRARWHVGYFPELSLSHLIPPGRLDAGYLARLNRGIQKSWMQVLSAHDANPWPALGATGAALRKVKAWWSYSGWAGPVARIRWQGACGHFDGRIKREETDVKAGA
jgi:glycosyltransferase involved in cell wall biosynthesis